MYPKRCYSCLTGSLISPKVTNGGSRKGSKGNAVRVRRTQCRGCPRNCKRRVSGPIVPLGALRLPGRRPGSDDPRARRSATATVTRERVGRGVLTNLVRLLHGP